MQGQTLRPQAYLTVPALVLFWLGTASTAGAQTYLWTSPSSGDWSIGSNWSDGFSPPSDATTQLIFLAGGSNSYTATNDLANPFLLRSISLNNSGTGLITIAPASGGGAITFTGASPSLSNIGAGSAEILNPLNLAASTVFAGAGAGTVTVAGTVNDGGSASGLNVSGPGMFVFSATGSSSINFLRLDSGPTQITAGTWALTGTSLTDATAAFIAGTTANQTATFTLSGGADLTTAGHMHFGEAAGSTGNGTITGSGTTVTATGANTGRLTVGNSGTGSLTISGGAVVTTREGVVGRNSGSTGTVVVTGTDSRWTTNGTLTIGQNGTGSLTVQNGGRVAPQIVGIGGGAGSVGTLTVTGTGSELITPVGGALNVLRGHFVVSAGGSATASDVQVYTLTSNASVVDAGTLTARNLFTVANGAAGQVTVQNGGVVTVGGSTFVGTNPSSVGTLTVTGANSRLTTTGTNFIIIGGGSGAGRGDLIVENGGKVEGSGGQITFAQDAGSSSVSRVDAGTLTAAGTLVVGQSGTASLTFQNGGTGTAASVSLGANSGSSGTLTVTGSGSLLSTAGPIRLGGFGTTPGGTAVLNVSSGGQVVSGDLLTLFAGGAANVTAGTLSVGGITHGTTSSIGNVTLTSGSLVITNGLGATYAGVISGGGSVTKSGTGTQTLTGVNTYTGATNVTFGTLALSGSGSIANSPIITVGNDGTLDVGGVTGGFNLASGQSLRGGGSVAGAVTAVSGSTVAPGTPAGAADLTFNGNLTLQSGSTLAIQIRPGVSGVVNDLAVQQTGEIAVTGSTLKLTGSTIPFQGTVLTIVLNTADSPVQGTFANPAVPGDPLDRLYLGDYIGNVSYFGSNGTISGGNDIVVYNIAPVPEPGSILAAVAVAGLAGAGLRRKVRRA